MKQLLMFLITQENCLHLSLQILCIFFPESIIVAGGLIKSGEILLNPVKKYFEKEILETYKGGKVEITTSSLPEQDAAILGAASLVI